MPDGDEWQDRYWKFQDNFQAKIDHLADQLAEGDLTEAQWRKGMQDVIGSSYDDAYRMGKAISMDGNARLTEDDRAIIQREITDEQGYLKGFYQDIKGGLLSDEQIAARAGQYGQGLTSLYWAGRISGWDEDTTIAWFKTTGGNPCDGCQEAELGSPYPSIEAPIPGSDVCEGFGFCRCELDFQTVHPAIVDAYSNTDEAEQGAIDENKGAVPTVRKSHRNYRTFADLRKACQT
jgi:hypothetical protein